MSYHKSKDTTVKLWTESKANHLYLCQKKHERRTEWKCGIHGNEYAKTVTGRGCAGSGGRPAKVQKGKYMRQPTECELRQPESKGGSSWGRCSKPPSYHLRGLGKRCKLLQLGPGGAPENFDLGLLFHLKITPEQPNKSLNQLPY